jgi:hypothetical protein
VESGEWRRWFRACSSGTAVFTRAKSSLLQFLQTDP